MDFVRRNKLDVKRNVASRNMERRTNDNRKPNNNGIVSNSKSLKERTIAGNHKKVPAAESFLIPKPGKPKIIPIRHTLTSKLRMEKANPLITSTLAPSQSELTLLKEINTPVRRATFHPGMQTKPKFDLTSIYPSSENRPTQKRSNAASVKKTASYLIKENKPPFVASHQTNKLPKVQPAKVLSKPSQSFPAKKDPLFSSQKSTTSLQKSFPAKKYPLSSSQKSTTSLQKSFPVKKDPLSSSQKYTTSLQNKSSTVPNRNVSAYPRNKLNPPAMCKGNNFKPVTSTFVPSNSKKISKDKAAEPRNVPSRQKAIDTQNQAAHPNTSVGPALNMQLKSILRRSASAGDLRKTALKGRMESETPSFSAKLLNKSQKSVAFYSPLHNSTFSPVNIVNTPPPSVLRKRLEDWLAKRGKPAYSYRHLCCFGLPKSGPVHPLGNSQIGNNSCLNETITLESSDSTAIVPPPLGQDSELDFESSVPNDSSTPEKIHEDCKENKENAAYIAHPEALVDLKKLVHSGYPRDQCEQWLSFICKSYPTVKELPQYWECLAALEEARGDFGAAVDCYGRAVVRGADAHDIDKQLDELWEKFSSLSVSAVETRRTPLKKLAVDSKQIFKSTVIKFALQQKAIKRTNREAGESIPLINYIVTPVRRSSRRSRSLFRTTPTVKCFNTLDDLEPNVKERMEFHGNSVLNPGN